MAVSTTFKAEDAASYDAVAGAFDDLTHRYARASARALTLAVSAADRRRVLDVGTGTGIVAFDVAAASAAEVIGIDLSEGMLRTARDKLAGVAAAPDGPATRLSFRTGDAEALDLPDGFADGYVSLNAYSHLPHPDRAATEAYRVLSPGGRIAVAIGSGPELLSADGVRRAVQAGLRAARIRLGRERTACTHLEQLVLRHLRDVPDPETSALAGVSRDFSGILRDLLRKAGFADVQQRWTGADFVIPTIEAFWQLQTTISTPARKRMALATEAARAAIKEAFWADCTAVLNRGGRLTYKVGAAIVTGRKTG